MSQALCMRQRRFMRRLFRFITQCPDRTDAILIIVATIIATGAEILG